ncbi:SDR family oxidoreductase [Streptomyces sp. NBC_01794]|nr:SDR family oxidoreductase [Streptomyces sp. NBC_01794]
MRRPLAGSPPKEAGLASLPRTLAGDAAPRGVRVNQVNPGTVRTPSWTADCSR